MADLFVAVDPGPAGAPRVVLIHGSLDRSTAFLRVARELQDLTVIRFDRRGYGRSLAVGASTSFDDQVSDLASVVGDEPAIVVGHSLGGIVGLTFASRHPELAPAVVAYEAPMPWLPTWPSNTAGGMAVASGDDGDAAEAFMRRIVGDDRWEALPPRTKAQRRAEGPALVAELRSLRPPNPAPYDPATFPVPVVAGHGGQSRPHHQEAARALARSVPCGELVVIEEASHGAHLTHPREFAGLVRRALGR
ncbi:MAG: alpha/beta fold hydrolase [Acidimicrobiales bacterium]